MLLEPRRPHFSAPFDLSDLVFDLLADSGGKEMQIVVSGYNVCLLLGTSMILVHHLLKFFGFMEYVVGVVEPLDVPNIPIAYSWVHAREAVLDWVLDTRGLVTKYRE